MGLAPCIWCGKFVETQYGRNTVFVRAPRTPSSMRIGDTYAFCSQRHFLGSGELEGRLKHLTPAMKRRSQVEEANNPKV